MTPEQKAILSRVVVDPDAWYRHVVDKFGPEQAETMLDEKCRRHADSGEATRAELESKAEIARRQERYLREQRMAELQAQREADLIALIDQRIAVAMRR